MPDLLTHLFLSISLALILRSKSPEEGCLIVLGGMMVDIERPFTFIAWKLSLEYFYLTNPFHSLLGVLLLSLACSNFFDLNDLEYRQRFYRIFIGGVFHLLADMTLYPWSEKGVFLLYPLKIPFSFNLFWPGFIGYPLLGLMICLIALFWYYLTRSRNNLLFYARKLYMYILYKM